MKLIWVALVRVFSLDIATMTSIRKVYSSCFKLLGACEGTLTCSTCHLILKQEDYDKLPQKPSDEEMDMLDLAYELTDT